MLFSLEVLIEVEIEVLIEVENPPTAETPSNLVRSRKSDSHEWVRNA